MAALDCSVTAALAATRFVWVAAGVIAGATVLGVGLVALRGVRRVRGPGGEDLEDLSDPQLGERCSQLGTNIRRLAAERAHGRPRSMLRDLPSSDRDLLRSEQEAYDRATRDLYEQLFSSEVTAVAQELRRRGHLGPEEVPSLSPPGDLAAGAQLGDRLLELARRLEGTDPAA